MRKILIGLLAASALAVAAPAYAGSPHGGYGGHGGGHHGGHWHPGPNINVGATATATSIVNVGVSAVTGNYIGMGIQLFGMLLPYMMQNQGCFQPHACGRQYAPQVVYRYRAVPMRRCEVRGESDSCVNSLGQIEKDGVVLGSRETQKVLASAYRDFNVALAKAKESSKLAAKQPAKSDPFASAPMPDKQMLRQLAMAKTYDDFISDSSPKPASVKTESSDERDIEVKIIKIKYDPNGVNL